MSQSTPTKHDGRAVPFAVAELLVLLEIGYFRLLITEFYQVRFPNFAGISLQSF